MSRKHYLNEQGLKKIVQEHINAERKLEQLQEQEEKINNFLERYEEGEELSEEEINELMGGLSALGKWGKQKAAGAATRAANNVKAAAGKAYGAAQKFAGDAAQQYQKGQRAAAINKQRKKVDKQQAANTKTVQKIAEKGNRINQIIKQHQAELNALKQQYKKLTGKDFVPGRAVANAQRYVNENGKKKD